GFSRNMHQLLLPCFPGLRIQPTHLLPARMKITPYNHHAKAPSSPGALVLKPRLPGRSSLRSYPITFSLLRSGLRVTETAPLGLPVQPLIESRVEWGTGGRRKIRRRPPHFRLPLADAFPMDR